MADLAHQQGNEFYKKGAFESAERSYLSAYKINPSEPKYASNLSAVYYEQGQYIDSIASIVNSWRSLRVKNSVDGVPNTPSITDPLAIKLSLRFLKAKLNSIAKGLISLHDKKKKNKGKTSESNAGIEQDIQTFCAELVENADATSQHLELQHVWGAWRKMRDDCQGHTAEQCKNNIEEAQKRLRALPIYKGTLYDVLDYFRFGHDYPRPLFYEVGSSNELLINEMTVLLEDWEKISFLFGGSGDGRHVYATLVNWGAIWKRISKRKFVDFRIPDIHMTLLDIHPASLSRVMLILALIRKSMTIRSVTAKLELEATAFYIWSTFLMPDYCAKLVAVVSQENIDELRGNLPRHLTKFWSIDEQTKTRILIIFEYWSKPLPKNTKTFLQINGPKDLSQNPARATMLEQRRQVREDRFNAYVDAATKIKGSPFDTRKDPQLPLYNDSYSEDRLFQRSRVLLPPKQLLSRHPALEKHVRSNGQQGEREVIEEVVKDWRPDPTVFDNNTTENIAFSESGGYPKLSFDEDPSLTMMGVLQVLRHYRDVHTQLSFDQTSFAIMQQLFDSLRECFTFMDSRDDALTLEFVCTEICSGLPKLMAGDFGPRPASFPKEYMRMWLSNVP